MPKKVVLLAGLVAGGGAAIAGLAGDDASDVDFMRNATVTIERLVGELRTDLETAEAPPPIVLPFDPFRPAPVPAPISVSSLDPEILSILDTMVEEARQIMVLLDDLEAGKPDRGPAQQALDAIARVDPPAPVPLPAASFAPVTPNVPTPNVPTPIVPDPIVPDPIVPEPIVPEPPSLLPPSPTPWGVLVTPVVPEPAPVLVPPADDGAGAVLPDTLLLPPPTPWDVGLPVVLPPPVVPPQPMASPASVRPSSWQIFVGVLPSGSVVKPGTTPLPGRGL